MQKGTRFSTRDLLPYVGNLSQLGGTRCYELSEGRSRGVRAVDVDTGSGLCFTLLPDRGMDISRCTYRGVNLAYHGGVGEVHPSFYEPHGQGWLRGFFAGLLTTCGLTYLGQPCHDGAEELGLHGRYSHSPASRINDLCGWEKDGRFRIELQADLQESLMMGPKLELRRRIVTHLGESRFLLHDRVTNSGGESCPLTLLYHFNVGYPLLDLPARFELEAESCEPEDQGSAEAMHERFRVTAPNPQFRDTNYLYSGFTTNAGWASARFFNPELRGGLGIAIGFKPEQLPYLNQWRMLGVRDYIMSIEPANAPCKSRHLLRERNQLPMLEPGEARDVELSIEVIEHGKSDVVG